MCVSVNRNRHRYVFLSPVILAARPARIAAPSILNAVRAMRGMRGSLIYYSISQTATMAGDSDNPSPVRGMTSPRGSGPAASPTKIKDEPLWEVDEETLNSGACG